MSDTGGIDFRATSGFVSDTTHDVEVASGAAPNYPVNYPVTGLVGGWESGSNIQSRDRDDTIDVRLAGINTNSGVDEQRFRINLTNGTYTITAAFGDASNATTQTIQFWDDTTSVASYSGVSVGSGSFMDAKGNVWSAAAWPGSNQGLNVTITNGILRCVLNPGGGGQSQIAFLAVAPAGGGGSTAPDDPLTRLTYVREWSAGEVFS